MFYLWIASHIASAIVPPSNMFCEITALTRTIRAEVACVGPFTSVCSHMCCESTLHTRTIRAEVARVGPFPSVGSHMCCEMTLLTRTIIAQDARVGLFTSVCPHMCCETTLHTRMIPAQVARIPLRRLQLLLPRRTLPPPLRLATTASPLPLHPACVFASLYSRSRVIRLVYMYLCKEGI